MKIKLFIVAVLLLFSVGIVNAGTFYLSPVNTTTTDPSFNISKINDSDLSVLQDFVYYYDFPPDPSYYYYINISYTLNTNYTNFTTDVYHSSGVQKFTVYVYNYTDTSYDLFNPLNNSVEWDSQNTSDDYIQNSIMLVSYKSSRIENAYSPKAPYRIAEARVSYYNTLPNIPTILTPIYNSIFKSRGVELNVSSTDVNNDTLTYYFYGDTNNGTTLINVSTSGVFNWYTEDYGVHSWKVQAYDGFEYGANTSLQQFQLIAPPDLQTPTNTSTHTYAFPPLLHDLTFAWQNISAPAYKYQVATDADFNLIAEEDTITSNTTTLSLEADDYYWRVYSYETSTDTLSNASDVWQFTINETNGGAAVTAIDGVVYEITNAGSIAVDGSLVNIWNNTWSDSMLVGQNGYYYFDGAKSGTYSVRATKTGYTDSSIELVTVQALNTTTRNILLQDYTGAGREYVTHYVLFTVKTLWGTLFSDVDVNVFLNGAVIAQYTGTTGTDGSIGFELVESSEYRLTFIDLSQGIDEEITLYPVKSAYPVYIIKSLLPDDEDIETEEITVSITTAEINTTHAYINVTYTDAMAETTDLNIFINQSDESDPFNQTVITSAALGATSIVTQSFLISNYEGQAYFVNIGATHTTFDSVKRTYAVRFDGMAEDYGFGRMWVWIAVGGMMLLGGMFKASKAKQGALIVCVAGWVFLAMGMFDVLGSGAKVSIGAGLGLGTVLAVMSLMAKKDREETT